MQKNVTTIVHSIRLASNIVDKDMCFVAIRRCTIQLSNNCLSFVSNGEITKNSLKSATFLPYLQ